MRIAALYDIHGNLPALEAVLDDVRRATVDVVVVGGDVFPGPMARDALALLRALSIPTQFILGNGDREVFDWRAGKRSPSLPEPLWPVMQWSAEQLDDDDATTIGAWPATLAIDAGPRGRVLFCHATPRNDTEIFTVQTPEQALAPVFANSGAPIVVCGHTHIQFDRMVGPTRVLNAGSVGMPFQEPGAYWLLLGSEVELRRTEFDLEAAAARIRGTTYPQAHQFTESNVLHPPAEAQMLALYATHELR